jgi:hypothetical protein
LGVLGLGLEAHGIGIVEDAQQRSEKKRTLLEQKLAFADKQNLAGAEREHFLAAASLFDPFPNYRIALYLECAEHCGGARIVYSDGTLKRYECSCEIEPAHERRAA